MRIFTAKWAKWQTGLQESIAMRRQIGKLLILALALLLSAPTWARDYYVSANRGEGKKATIENPAKDLGNIATKLRPGDTVHIAEGTYLGRGKNGSDVITVPVSIIGGYDDNFTGRHPWGSHRTILSGDNRSKHWLATPRLMIDLMRYKEKGMPPIVIDGVIIDHAGRNRYKTEKQMEIVRTADRKTGQHPTPNMGGLVIQVSKTDNSDFRAVWDITVQNCIIMNTAPSQGALNVSGYRRSQVKIRNNLIINNTGTGILIGSNFAGNAYFPDFLVENNTVLFTWKYDPGAQSYSGNAFKAERRTTATVQNNVFAFADRYGVHNAAKIPILLNDNLFAGNIKADYVDFDTEIALENVGAKAQYLYRDSEGNVNEKISLPVNANWAKAYGSRALLNPTAKMQPTVISNIREMLALPLQTGTIEAPSSPVWLPRLSVDNAVKIGAKKYKGKYGCSMPYTEFNSLVPIW